jgi:hypothetical protein
MKNWQDSSYIWSIFLIEKCREKGYNDKGK